MSTVTVRVHGRDGDITTALYAAKGQPVEVRFIRDNASHTVHMSKEEAAKLADQLKSIQGKD